MLHGKILRMFDFYEAETKNGKKLEFRKLHELESGAVTRVAELLAQEWEERTAAGQVTFRHGDEIVWLFREKHFDPSEFTMTCQVLCVKSVCLC